MTTSDPTLAQWRAPTPWSSAVFAAKAMALRIKRGIVDLGDGPRRLAKTDPGGFPHRVIETRSPLLSDPRPEERALQLGKVRNLTLAATILDGVAIPAGQVFSFWRQLGPATTARGFVVGRMLQEGCLVPAVGGGLCQLSNLLYQAARAADCEIVERHRHSRIVPGSEAEVGRDATVAWNYVDLRFRARHAIRLETRVEGEDLVVAITAALPMAAMVPQWEAAQASVLARSCATCDETDCHRHEDGASGR